MSAGQDTLASLDGQMADLDKRIRANEEELEEATRANCFFWWPVSKKFIDNIEKKIDRLWEDKRALRR